MTVPPPQASAPELRVDELSTRAKQLQESIARDAKMDLKSIVLKRGDDAAKAAVQEAPTPLNMKLPEVHEIPYDELVKGRKLGVGGFKVVFKGTYR